MDNEQQYITVKEFADKANVSVQAIYQRIDRDLKQYLKIIKGKKYLSIEGLQLFIKDDSTSIKQVLNKSALNDFKENTETADNATIELLNKTLKTLQEQLTVKDKQISELQAALKAEQEHSAQLTQALTQQQALHAGTIQQQLEQRSDVPTASEREPSESVPDAVPVPDQEEPQQQHDTFLSRLFSKLKKKT